MIIDFHTHAFPDKIAARTLESLKGGIKRERGIDAPSFADGTVNGLRKSMKENKVNLSVVLPIATSPKQTATINSVALENKGNGLYSFASLHPMQEDWEQVMENIGAAGFAGIKLHPEFQLVDIDSPQSLRIFQKAEKLNLIVVYHAGVDVGMPAPVHSTPLMLKHVLEYVSGEGIVAAHMGGFEMWDDVEKYIVGTSVYLDTAVCSQYMNREQYKRIIIEHGTDKILFGSDSPWESPSDTYKALAQMNLTAADMDNITYNNAARLLGRHGVDVSLYQVE